MEKLGRVRRVPLESLQSRRLSRCQHAEQAVLEVGNQPSNPVKEGNALLALVVVVVDGAALTGGSSKPPRRSTSGSFGSGAGGAETVCVRKEEPAVAREEVLCLETEDLRATVSSSPAVYSSKSRRPMLSLKPPELPPE